MRNVSLDVADSAREQLRRLKTSWPEGARDVARTIGRLETFPYAGRYIGGDHGLRVLIAPRARYQVVYKARPDYDTDPGLDLSDVTDSHVVVLLLVPTGAELEEWLP